jgi:peptidoglycan/xylan/chitin deacetylase (PgdA/CDA1 family)
LKISDERPNDPATGGELIRELESVSPAACPTIEEGVPIECLLTFDDGPHPTVTACVLDALAESDLTAVFFVVGHQLRSSIGMGLARRAADAGHVLGNHTFSHRQLVGMSEDKVRDELRRTHDLISECGSCPIFRPPFGAIDHMVSEVVAGMGYETLLWNVDTLDWKLRMSGGWVDHAINQMVTHRRPVVLMHDLHRSTADNLPRLLDLISLDPSRHVANAASWPQFLLPSKFAAPKNSVPTPLT